MDSQPNENFFELKVSQEGSARILRLFKIVRWLFLVALLCSLMFVGYGFLRLFTIDRYDDIPDWQFQAEIVASPVYSIIVTILFLVQTHSYFHFTRLCKKAIQLQQADLFNYSFKWLIRHALVSLNILIIEFLMGCFSFYVAIHLLQKYPAP
jgi:hypothetical protein